MTIHELKCWTECFKAIYTCQKTFEVRKNDRNFQVGDTLRLQEYSPETQEYSGVSCEVKVDYVLQGGTLGVQDGYCVMGISPIRTGRTENLENTPPLTRAVLEARRKEKEGEK